MLITLYPPKILTGLSCYQRPLTTCRQVATAEIRLLEATAKRLIEAQTDNIVGMLVLVVALSYGSLFLLGGIVLLIHLWLAWWLSFLITGVAISSAGAGFALTMRAAAKAKSA
jgi:hypothetical protein